MEKEKNKNNQTKSKEPIAEIMMADITNPPLGGCYIPGFGRCAIALRIDKKTIKYYWMPQGIDSKILKKATKNFSEIMKENKVIDYKIINGYMPSHIVHYDDPKMCSYDPEQEITEWRINTEIVEEFRKSLDSLLKTEIPYRMPSNLKKNLKDQMESQAEKIGLHAKLVLADTLNKYYRK